MKNKIEFKNGELTLKLNLFDDLVDGLNEADTSELIEQLSCSDEVIKHVIDQIFDGYTVSGYHGWEISGASATAYRGLAMARDTIAKRSDELVKKRIEDLEKLVKTHENEINELNRTARLRKKLNY